MKSRPLSAASACVVAVLSQGVQGTPIATGYNIDVLGFTDAEHTRNDGYRFSSPGRFNEAGQVAGYAERYNGTGTSLGRTAWLYNGTSTLNIGLTDADHTRAVNGYRKSNVIRLNEAGQVLGNADRYNGTVALMGSTAWLYNGTSTQKLGLTDTEHTRDDGNRSSSANFLNEAGQVSGESIRYNGTSTSLGRTAWLYNGTSTLNIGLTDAEHTGDDGYRSSNVRGLNEAGQVAGNAIRYGSTGLSNGQTAWLYNGTSTLNIGLTDTEHTRNDGHRDSSAKLLNKAGQVAGIATRYNGGTSVVGLGDTAWLYNGTSTLNVGLTDTEHTRDNGYRSSNVRRLNEAGQVAGIATRYNGSGTLRGTTAWLYNGTSTLNIGLTDAEHTLGSWRSSNVFDLNEAGQAMGSSQRFNVFGTSMGQTAWLYNGTSTQNIGLTDAGHTRIDGYRSSTVNYLNEAGQVAGYAERYSGTSTPLGQTAWLFDLTLDQTFALELSVRSDGYAYSKVQYLGDDGLTLGWYELYDTDDTLLGNRAFAFSVEDGLFDLGGLVDGGLNAAGWENLAAAHSANSLGQIVGFGLLNDGMTGQMGYLLTPVSAVPLPGTVWLFGSGVLGLVAVSRRNTPIKSLCLS